MDLRHPSRRQLLMYDGGELSARRMRSVSRHLRRCAECRRSLARRRDLRAVAAEVTSPRASGDFDDVRRRLESCEVVLLPTVPGAPPLARSRRLRAVGIAAAMVVIAAAGVAAVGVVREGLRDADRPAATSAAATRTAGFEVAVPPSGLEIDLAAVGDGVELVVETLHEASLRVVVVGPSTEEPRFQVGSRGVAVRGVRSGQIRVGVPVTALGPVRFVAGDHHLAVAQDGQVVLRGREAGAADSARLGILRGSGGRR